MSIQKFDYSTDLLKSVLWQHNNAENLQALLQKKQDWYANNYTKFWEDWQRDVFDLRTANDFGLSVWSVILDLPLFDSDSTIEPSPGDYEAFGFDPFGFNFSNGNFATDATAVTGLPTEQKRILLRLRYFQLVTRAAIPEINRFLSDLFGPGNLYALDGLDMTMNYVYVGQEALSLQSIIEQFDLLPRPAGVEITSVQAAQSSFGFGDFNENFNDSNFSASGFSAEALTIVADTGSYSYLGGESFFLSNGVLTAEGGGFGYLGVDAEIILQRFMGADTAIYTLSVPDAILRLNVGLSAETVSFFNAGQDVELLAAKNTFAVSHGTGNESTPVDDRPILYDDDAIERRFIPTSANNEGYGVSDVSRDGRYLAFIRGAGNTAATFEIYVYDLYKSSIVNGYPITITNSNFYDSTFEEYQIKSIRISPDNQRVAYSTSFTFGGSSSPIEVRNLQTGSIVNSTTFSGLRAESFIWSGSDEIIVVKGSGTNGVTSYSKLYNVTTNAQSEISFSSTEFGRDYIDISLDLSTIFYTTTVSSITRLYAVSNTSGFPGVNIFPANPGQNYLEFSGNENEFLTPRLSRDGNYLALLATRQTSGSRNLHVLENVSGDFSLIQSLSTNAITRAFLDWNSDSTKLIIGDSLAGIDAFNFDGTTLTDDPGFSASLGSARSVSFGGPLI